MHNEETMNSPREAMLETGKGIAKKAAINFATNVVIKMSIVDDSLAVEAITEAMMVSAMALAPTIGKGESLQELTDSAIDVLAEEAKRKAVIGIEKFKAARPDAEHEALAAYARRIVRENEEVAKQHTKEVVSNIVGKMKSSNI